MKWLSRMYRGNDNSPLRMIIMNLKYNNVSCFCPTTLNCTGANRWRVVCGEDCGLPIKIEERERGKGVDGNHKVGRIMMDHGILPGRRDMKLVRQNER